MNALPLIVGITWLAVISPGADFAMISRNSFLHGRRAGMLAALGIAISLLVPCVLRGVRADRYGTAVSPSPQYRENRRCGLSGLRGSGDGPGAACDPGKGLASQRIFNAAIGAVLVLLGTALALFDASHALDG